MPRIKDGRQQFTSVISEVILHTGTLDPASLVDGAGATSTFAIPGAAVGDWVLAAAGVDVAGISLTAWVSAAGVVSVRLQNESGGTLDLATSTWRILVLKAALT